MLHFSQVYVWKTTLHSVSLGLLCMLKHVNLPTGDRTSLKCFTSFDLQLFNPGGTKDRSMPVLTCLCLFFLKLISNTKNVLLSAFGRWSCIHSSLCWSVGFYMICYTVDKTVWMGFKALPIHCSYTHLSSNKKMKAFVIRWAPFSLDCFLPFVCASVVCGSLTLRLSFLSAWSSATSFSLDFWRVKVLNWFQEARHFPHVTLLRCITGRSTLFSVYAVKSELLCIWCV